MMLEVLHVLNLRLNIYIIYLNRNETIETNYLSFLRNNKTDQSSLYLDSTMPTNRIYSQLLRISQKQYTARK